MDWWRKAAEQGVAEAQYRLGYCYHDGDGVPKNPNEAVEWWRKAAELGFAEAQSLLGSCYHEGNGVLKDLARAVEWWRKAADQGYAVAQLMLGWCHYDGEGVPKDPDQAAEWFRKAGEQGMADAQDTLGQFYFYGNGVPKDPEKAVKLFREAAGKGHANAQNNLASCYQDGVGTKKDLVQAYLWFTFAAAQGHEAAATDCGKIKEQMTPEQIAEAEQLAAVHTCKPVELANAQRKNSSTKIEVSLQRNGDFQFAGVEWNDAGIPELGADEDYEFWLTIPACEKGRMVDMLKDLAKAGSKTVPNLSNDVDQALMQLITGLFTGDERATISLRKMMDEQEIKYSSASY